MWAATNHVEAVFADQLVDKMTLSKQLSRDTMETANFWIQRLAKYMAFSFRWRLENCHLEG